MTDVTVAIEWLPFDHFGFGFGIDSFDLRVRKDDDSNIPGVDFRGSVELEYSGITYYLKGYF